MRQKSFGMSGRGPEKGGGFGFVPVLAAVLCLSVSGVHAQTPDRGTADKPSPSLPAKNSVSPRSPGMSLSGGDSVPENPFAEPDPADEKSPEQIESEIRERAFNASITGLLPLQPMEIRKLLERYDRTQQAVEIPVYPYPEPEVVVETVSLDPGATPPVVKLGVGHVTSLTILDVTGAPWPIMDITWAGNFEVAQPSSGNAEHPATTGHMIRITPMSEFAYGNISVRLIELKTPVIFTLKTEREKVHVRFDARIPEYGPFASAPIIEAGITTVAGDSVLNAILDGVPPQGAGRVDVSGADARTTAYKYNGSTYVRTPLTLLSPGWSSSVSSADGMNVYTVANAPVLLLSDQGRMVRARLSEGNSSDE